MQYFGGLYGELDDGADQRAGQRHIRRRLADHRIRRPEPGEHAGRSNTQPYWSTPSASSILDSNATGAVWRRAERDGEFIVDNLFIGTNCPPRRSRLRTTSAWISARSAGDRGFLFQGDNITPPQQALGWILDLTTASRTSASGRPSSTRCTTIGHRWHCFGGVAKKEHQEFASNIDLIDCRRPACSCPDAEDVRSGRGRFGRRSSCRSSRAPRGHPHRRPAGRAHSDRPGSFQGKLGLIGGSPNLWCAPSAAPTGQTSSVRCIRCVGLQRRSRSLDGDGAPAAEGPSGGRLPITCWRSRRPFRVASPKPRAYRDWRDQAYEHTFWSIFGGRPPPGCAWPGRAGRLPRPSPVNRPITASSSNARLPIWSPISSGGPTEGIRAVLYISGPQGAADERQFELLRRACVEHAIGLDTLKAAAGRRLRCCRTAGNCDAAKAQRGQRTVSWCWGSFGAWRQPGAEEEPKNVLKDRSDVQWGSAESRPSPLRSETRPAPRAPYNLKPRQIETTFFKNARRPASVDSSIPRPGRSSCT